MKKNLNKNPFKYYFKGTQVAITILVSVFVGYQIDKFLDHNKYIITILFSIISIFYTLYALIKDVSGEK